MRPVSEGIPFLGFVVFPEHRRLKRRKGIAFARRLRLLAALPPPGEISRWKSCGLRPGLDQPRALRQYRGAAQGRSGAHPSVLPAEGST